MENRPDQASPRFRRPQKALAWPPGVLYQIAITQAIISGIGVPPAPAQTNACGYRKNYLYEGDLV
jgi:hypothetical protein